MRIVFHGENAQCFMDGFADLVDPSAEMIGLPDRLSSAQEEELYASAEVIVGVGFSTSLPRPKRLSLFHVPGAGYNAVDLDAVPSAAVVCNCFGHEQAIAEYVMSAILSRHVPLPDADQRLRAGDWAYYAGRADSAHDEIAGKTIGLLGFGHIGKAIARRAKAFEMKVSVANRSPVDAPELVDHAFTLDQLEAFWGTADVLVVSLPLTEQTTSIVGPAAFAAMRPDAVVINVGRGPTIDQDALFEALAGERIGGAVIDTWYDYPSAAAPSVLPAARPFHKLPNIVMTPHMSGWTRGTIRRRQRTIAENIRRRAAGEPCINVVKAEAAN